MNMAKNFSNVMDYKVVANNGFTFNVNVYGVNNLGNRKWMLRAVDVIRDYFTFDDDDVDNGLIINVVVNTHEIIVKAEFNGKKYFAFPIQPRYGKNQIKDILDNMGVVKDVIDVYTNNMVNNNMEENNMANMVNSVDMTGIDENGFAIDGLAYVNENMCVVDVDMIKDCIEECVEDLCLAEDGKRMDFEGFCDVLWTNYVWDRVLNSGCTDEALENETRYVMEFNDRVRYIVENDIDMLYVNCYDEIGVDDMVKNNPPCLDRVVNTIKDYVDNYEGILMNYDGYSVSICVPWDVFSEDDMKMFIEDEVFEACVVGALMKTDIYDVLVYDDGVYVSVDAEMFDKVA